MKFNQPIFLVMRPAEEPISFSTDTELQAWLEHQVDTWGKHWEAVKSEAEQIPYAGPWIAQNLSHWQNHTATARTHIQGSESEREMQLRAHLSQVQHMLNQRELIWSGDLLAQKSFAVTSSDPLSSVFLMLLSLGHLRWMLVSSENRIWWSEFGRAMFLGQDEKGVEFIRRQHDAIARIEKLTAATSSQIEENRVAGENGVKSFSEFMGQSTSRFDDALLKSQEDSARQREEFSNEWLKLRSAYDAEMKLRAPREYWEAKFVEHGSLARGWSIAFVIAAVVAAVVIALSLAALVREWVVVPNSLGAYAWVVPTALLGAPVFLAIWILRFFGRQWSDHLMRREDARERKVMIETFLAISRDNDSPGIVTDPAQLGLILSSIFRPGPGMAIDDSPPAGFFDAILAKLSSK